MINDLQARLSAAKEREVIRLRGEIVLKAGNNNNYVRGGEFCKNILMITRSDVTVDGAEAAIVLDLDESPGVDLNVIFVGGGAKNVTLRNLKMTVRYRGEAGNCRINAIANCSYGLKIQNCAIEMAADRPIGLIGIANDGNLNTHMNTRADNLIVENSNIAVRCVPERTERACAVYGIYNNLANSVSVQNTFVFASIKGEGGLQKAVGIFTNGRFGRFVGNNVKANGCHPAGKLLEQAHAFGMVNEGPYTLISANNIVGEWAGRCVGLENAGDNANVSGNKFLATHTMNACSVRSRANGCVIHGNVMVSTGRNFRLLDLEGKHCAVSGNLLEGLVAPGASLTGCGIYAANAPASEHAISGNLIKNVKDCGILTADGAVAVSLNTFVPLEGTEGFVPSSGSDPYLLELLSESNLYSLPL